ncbi:hypothetical protein SteCoe_19951 [Stentor coeruleus]|uniref:G-protein coupled receptors family 1 profile domain-containing protein n=1 Tax=Stentor coeruleus TaxID=5963 RepID=A0A1R2BT35_9CILI|nr:hypothetical protein SteCoe_19951 [Stentor coeruleus]
MKCFLSYDDAIYYYSHLGCGILSALGSMLIILFYILTPRIQIYSYKLVAFLAFSQLLSSIDFIFPKSLVQNTQVGCIFIGFIVNTGQITSILWMASIAVTLYQVIFHSIVMYEKYEKYWFIGSWILVPILNCIPIFTNSFKPVGSTCTYNVDTIGNIERICIFFIPIWTFLLLTLYCYWKILTQAKINNEVSKHSIIIKRLMYYPCIMAFNAVILTVTRFLPFIISNCEEMFVEFVLYTFIALNGFLNFILFLLTPTVRMILFGGSGGRISCTEDASDGSTLNLLLDDTLRRQSATK